jgi:hypothetical protein
MEDNGGSFRRAEAMPVSVIHSPAPLNFLRRRSACLSMGQEGMEWASYELPAVEGGGLPEVD